MRETHSIIFIPNFSQLNVTRTRQESKFAFQNFHQECAYGPMLTMGIMQDRNIEVGLFFDHTNGKKTLNVGMVYASCASPAAQNLL